VTSNRVPDLSMAKAIRAIFRATVSRAGTLSLSEHAASCSDAARSAELRCVRGAEVGLGVSHSRRQVWMNRAALPLVLGVQGLVRTWRIANCG
jgi:hypothetical protein